MMAALAFGGLYIVGKVKTPDGKTIAEQIAEEIAKQASRGAVGAVGGAVGGTIEGTKAGANDIYAAGQSSGTGMTPWEVPTKGGFIKAAPGDMLIEAAKDWRIAWNLLPFLPDY